MIPEVVTLVFDPATANKKIKKVFSDDLARTLWLAVRYGHIVGDQFNLKCLFYAQKIRRIKKEAAGPITAEYLLRLLSGWYPTGGIIGFAELNFARDLLPFINGEKTIRYEVNVKRQTEEESVRERLSGLGRGGL